MSGRKGIAMMLALSLMLAMQGCSSDSIPEAGDDEIQLRIQMDVKEDIGLLIIDYDADGTGGSGGTSNADKSMLKHDELIVYTLDRQSFDNRTEIDNLSIQFSIITEYVDPNYENIYPEEYTVPLEAISFEADYGETYCIVITGDKVNGYTAVLAD